MDNPESTREPRREKVAVVAEVKERLETATSVVVTEYRGLTVAQLQQLRGALRPAGGRYKVYKNTLVRRAADEAGMDLAEHLTGPTALAFAEPVGDDERGDVVTVAKVLRDFAKAHPDLVIKGGLFDGQPIDADGIRALADIEPREVLLAKLAGAMAAPMQQFAGLLQALPRDFAYGLQALIDKGGAGEVSEPTADDNAETAPDTASESTPEEPTDAAEAGEVSEAADAESSDDAAAPDTEEAGEEE
jgi:large subunit ribosomal protein L10